MTSNAPPTDAAPLIACRGLRIGHGGRALLPPIDLDIGTDEFWAVVGRNGSGKSTFMKTLLGLLSPVGGAARRGRDDVRLTYMPQVMSLEPMLPIRVDDLVLWGRLRGWNFRRPTASAGDRRARDEVLAEMEAAHLAHRVFRDLSEGQKQRVLFARLLASGAHVAFLDEPTAAMDAVAEREAFLRLRDYGRRHHVTIVVVSHFMGVARECADQVLFLDPDHQAVVQGPPEDVLASPEYQRRYGSAEIVDENGGGEIDAGCAS